MKEKTAFKGIPDTAQQVEYPQSSLFGYAHEGSILPGDLRWLVPPLPSSAPLRPDAKVLEPVRDKVSLLTSSCCPPQRPACPSAPSPASLCLQTVYPAAFAGC